MNTYNPLDRVWSFDWKEFVAGVFAFGLAMAFVYGVMVAI